MSTSLNKTVCCVIPCFNYGKYLEEAIESVLTQTRVPDEIIAVDDCSTDNTAEIIAKYPQITYIKHDKNRGLSASRNTGIRASKSQYCFSFDADDILRPEAVEKHLELADENKIVTLGLMAFGAENYTARPQVATIEILLKTNCIYSNSLFSKKMWEDVGGFDESDVMRLGLEDHLFWTECAAIGAEFVIGDYVGLLWRRHPLTMSTTSANPNWDKITSYMRNKMKEKYNLQ